MSEPRSFPVYFNSENTENIDEEKRKKIQKYFQIRRKSGGGECGPLTEVAPGLYRVDFKDRQAQQRVLERRQHNVGVAGPPLVLIVRDGPGPAAPGPVSSPKQELPASPLHHSGSTSSLPPGGEEHEVQVNLYLLQYLRDSVNANSELNYELRSLQSTAKLCPENEKAIVRSLVLFDDAEAAKAWKTAVEGVFDQIKVKYHCHFECGAELRALLLKSCNTCQEQGDVKVYSESEVAVVVGMTLDIQATIKHANDHHVKICGPSFGQKQSRKRSFSEAKLCLLRKEIQQSLAKVVPSLQVTEGEEGLLVFEGTAEEINKAYDVIDDKENMLKERTVSDVSKHLLAFLNKAYSGGRSLSDFLGSGESVVIELKPPKIKILSLSEKEIEQTVKTLKETFTEEQIVVPNCLEVPVELQNRLKSEEKRMNQTKHKVYVDFAKNFVTLLGHAEEVKELRGAASEFILDQSDVEDRVQVPFPELARKLPELLTLNGFDFTGVKFDPLQSGSVALEGPSGAVTQVRSDLTKFLPSLVKENVIIDKPGALRYFETQNGAEKSQEAASSLKCLLQLEEATAASAEAEVAARYISKQGVQVIVILGDITKQEADVLVNAANEELRHCGGVALALSKAGGPDVQKESSDLVKSNGKIRTGNVVMTSGGNLKCKKLLHAVGPTKQRAGGRERIILEETVASTLVLAESLDFGSIALPCISSGVFGVPVDVCSEAIASAVRAFAAVEGRRLRKITLIDKRREVVQSLKAACDRALGGGEVEGAGSAEEATGAAPKEESVRVEIVQGALKYELVDCLVCPMLGHQPDSLRVGKALQSVVGAALAIRFNQASGGATLPGGTVLVEGLHGLPSNTVIFLNLINYNNQQEHAKQVLRSSVRSALSSCEARGFSSVAFPVLGVGGVLQFPVNVAALELLQEIQAFERKRAAKTPFLIRIVIHPNEKDAGKAFQAAQQTVRLRGFTNDANPNHASFYRHVSSAPSEVSALMGGVKLHVVQSDIIHEKSDVIVNSTNFKMEPAGVSRAILTAAGPSVQAELRRVAETAEHMCQTGAGLLGCKEIVHIQTDRDPQGFNRTCKSVLKLCESKGYTSVSFPAINTGIGQMDLGKASKAMLDAMTAAIRELNPKSVAVINIVILLQPVFDAFRAELENRFGQEAPSPNFMGKLKNLGQKLKKSRTGAIIGPSKPQPAVFSVIACTATALPALKNALEALVQKQLIEKEFELQELCRLTEMEVAAVQAKARSFGVSLDHRIRQNTNAGKLEAKNRANSGEKIVVLSGLKEDVFIVADLVNKAIKNALSEDLREREEESLAQRVQWMYLEDGEDWKNFSLKQNSMLEEAEKKQEVFVKTEVNGNKVKVNLKALEATVKTTGKKYGVKRCEMDTDIELPGYWNPMAGENFKKVELDPKSKEFQDIARGFFKTAKFKIHKIERVQNFHLWRSFFVMKQKMFMKNGAAELGEKYLYHGTSAETCDCIEKDRFDRSHTGKNAAAYGKGVYFAIDADYSAGHRYSKPDAAGLKRMYVARVLTGRHTLGNSSMVVLPKRSADPSDRYDSLVDNLQSPRMFVIFHDDQAYPEYLITFS
ncbi:protein mono-ADP-ribosyltransferase PARP14-like [Eucyclogobius newberryi]|uniref:protein mono-ADP-ribosyltransferase PARP14-like n=1 Tax=Eucyclogobius newberryi TaxID=166745 RepID=UPI003B5A02F7